MRGILIVIVCASSTMACGSSGHQQPPAGIPVRGANFVQAGNVPFDHASATQSLRELERVGGTIVALVPFVWQKDVHNPTPVPGSSVTDAQLVAAIRSAHAQGLMVMLKPHVWVPGRWAGHIEMRSAADWDLWFANYQGLLLHYAEIAAAEKVEAFSLGTELEKTGKQGQWAALIRAIRAVYPGKLTYVAHGPEELAALPFRDQLDILALSLYPDLSGAETTRDQRLRMRNILASLRQAQAQTGKPVWIAELGIRSLGDAHRKPWQSPEERDGPPDALAQAQLLALWLDEIRAAGIGGVLLWYWSSDPAAGGAANTDFTVQNKAATGVLLCQWRAMC